MKIVEVKEMIENGVLEREIERNGGLRREEIFSCDMCGLNKNLIWSTWL